MAYDRLLPLSGVLNFRDLGGYPTVAGRATRWGRLFRSDALYALTQGDLASLDALDIVTVIDLRTQVEIAYTGRGLLARSPITLIETDASNEHPPMPPTATFVDEGSLDEVYWRYLNSESVNFVRALQELGRPEAYPAVISCFFGKDRTGVLAALVLSCLGVKRDAIVEDYALSASRTQRLIERLRDDPVYNETLDRTPTWRLASTPVTMTTFLATLDEQFGGARSWAMGAGVTSTQLENLSAALLE